MHSRGASRYRSHTRQHLCMAVLLLALAGCGGADGPRATTPSPRPQTTSAAPSSPEAPPPDATAERVDAVLAGLDRRQQIAQLFVVGVALSDLDAGNALVGEDGVGGVFLAGRSTIPAAELAAVTAGWAAAAPTLRPWVATDQEGGAVQTLSGSGFADLPPAVEQGALPDADLARLADELGAALAGAGVTLDLAPVADVVPAGTESGNAPIGAHGRQFGSTAADVVPAAGALIDGLATHGVAATVKHFPGLGRVAGNTDDTAVTDTVTAATDEQVAAFATLARSPAGPFVMPSSATYARIDPTAPAAFSRVVITDLLRGQLGFGGVVISDDLGSAQAVADVPPGERAVRFLAAGGTLVLTVTPTVFPAMLDAVLARDAADPAFAAQLDAAVRIALSAKAGHGLIG